MFAPCGVAFLAIGLRGGRTLAAMVGVILGGVTVAGTVGGLRYFAATAIVAAVRYILRVF